MTDTITAVYTDTVTGQTGTATATLTVATVSNSVKRFGCNQNQWDSVAPSVGPMTIQRSFKSISNGWPVAPVGVATHWSTYPKHDDLLSGSLDSLYATALRNAPPGSLLTAWHEPELHSGRSTGPTMAELADINRYLLAFTHAHTSNVLFGSVITAHADAGWCIPGLDFYGVDSYDWQGHADPATELSNWSARMPDGPRVVAETNTMTASKRPSWFEGEYEWLKANGGIAMMTFWNPGGGLSGPFLPDDAATITILNQIAADVAAG